jgi:hypothetical protein
MTDDPGAPVHKLVYGWGFTSERTEYRTGEAVKVLFPYIATDTSYSFYVDGKDADISYEDGIFVIRFIMPDHDVEVSYTSRNTMVCRGPGPGFFSMNPPGGAERPASEEDVALPEGEWACERCGARNQGRFCCECGSSRPR